MKETGKLGFTHNPFSMPQGGLEALNEKDPLDILAYQYDIVCNGVELSSGAVRNHDMEIMEKAFDIAGYDKETLKRQIRSIIQCIPVRCTTTCRNGTRSRPYDHVTSQRRKHPRDHRFPNERNSTGSDVRSTKRDYRTAAS